VNPSTALATVVVDELVRAGAREAVLSPGSRNAPLAFALHAAERAGRLRLHVRIDERGAGFLALGLAKATGRHVPVVTTSGTAAVNLHPAVVEAEYARVPLVAVTADRPAEMHGVGANQTIDQTRLFGRSVASELHLSVEHPGGVPGWRSALDHALADGQHRPVHLNIALREPLVPTDEPAWPSPLDVEPETERAHRGGRRIWGYAPLPGGGRTLVVAGDTAVPQLRRLAESAGWPLLAEPSSGHRAGPNALAAYRLYLDEIARDVERVVVAGRPTSSRPVTRLLARDDVEVVRLPDDPRTPEVDGPGDESWLRRWVDADRAAVAAVTTVLDGEPVNGPAVARAVAAAVPADGLLVAGSSSPVRDLDLADPWTDPPLVLANRGASGIDGTVSTAVGAALAHGGPALALAGDLTFLHDATGLVIGPDEPVPDLTIVVVNDDGGGLFSQLEQGAPQLAGSFERLFGTPHGTDLGALCAATATAYDSVSSVDALCRTLSRPSAGLRVVEARVDRTRTRELHARLRAAAQTAVG
jgi:2-succinyl-5-enolpyruvyl-6-hydroxy-3-cyclohexene-1-carboxylate synthase